MFPSAVAFVALAASLASAATTPKTLAAAASPRYFGSALSIGHLNNASDPQYAYLASTQFNGVTPENEMKWEIVEPQQNVFNFTQGEGVAKFAADNDMVLRGHTLVWHSQLAPWVSKLSGTALEKAMKNHIVMVMTQFRTRIYAWDVVNEAFNEDGTFRSSPFFDNFGSGFIETAFTTARSVKDSAKLYYNDYNIEGINAKSDAAYKLVKTLHKKKLIDGVGFQSHFVVGTVPTDLQANLQRFADLGLDVALTELDIRAPTPITQAVINQHAKDFAYVVAACKAVSRCVGITTWGVTDRYSWIPGVFKGEDYGLLYDDKYNTKKAYTQVIKALKA